MEKSNISTPKWQKVKQPEAEEKLAYLLKKPLHTTFLGQYQSLYFHPLIQLQDQSGWLVPSLSVEDSSQAKSRKKPQKAANRRKKLQKVTKSRQQQQKVENVTKCRKKPQKAAKSRK